jgi:hypothetical protein
MTIPLVNYFDDAVPLIDPDEEVGVDRSSLPPPIASDGHQLIGFLALHRS